MGSGYDGLRLFGCLLICSILGFALSDEITTTAQPPAACTDAFFECASLQSVCIGSVIMYQIQQLAQVEALFENGTELAKVNLPRVGSAIDSTESSTPSDADLKQEIENNLPLIKESLPLLRESLPLMRESLPLIRKVLDSQYASDASSCQKKATCKSCKNCGDLRDAITNFVSTLCPVTCKTCGQMTLSRSSTANMLAAFYD